MVKLTVRWLPALVLALVFQGCAPQAYKAPISQFQEASKVVVETTKVNLTEANKVERDAYLDDTFSKWREHKKIVLEDMKKKELLTPEDIAVRVKALNQLAKYGELLVKLANSDTPENIRKSAVGLGDNLKNLQQTLTAQGAEINDGFKNAIGPVSAIIGEVAKAAMELKIKQALDQAVIQGEEPIKALINLLLQDATNAYNRKKQYMSRIRRYLVIEYNTEVIKEKPNQEILRKYADQLKVHLDKWESFADLNPRSSLEAMAEAHTALVTYAKSKKGPEDLTDFIKSMEDFLQRAKIVASAFDQLQNL